MLMQKVMNYGCAYVGWKDRYEKRLMHSMEERDGEKKENEL